MTRPLLRLGTRASKLALIQAHETRDRLALAHPALSQADAVEIVPIVTTGDSVQNRLLSEIGGKGLFTKEIDEALLAGRIDIAVHSMKDLPTALPDGIVIGAVLPREDPRDALIGAGRIADLPDGATLGTASLRRAAQARALRPDLVIVPLRGNVDTRLRKIAAGEAQATLLAVAGLKRLGVLDKAGAALAPEEMLPSVAQGAIAVACRAGDPRVAGWLAAIDDMPSRRRVTAERAMLEVLDGSCRTPIAGLAEIDGTTLRLRGLVASVDGTRVDRAERSGGAADAEALGRALGETLKAMAPRGGA
ncbi:MAG: hydroxymethylbilane synthase [Alphaproteobacteria bacterium]|nr:hydroxymethylbilane synthase [Alphaproteobacteria bacterium]